MRAEVRRSPALHHPSDRGPAARAWQRFSIVHLEAVNAIIAIATGGTLRLVEYRTNRVEEPSLPQLTQRGGNHPRIDPREPERLRRIDVADARENPLVEEGHLDRYTAPRERLPKDLDRHRGIGRVGSNCRERSRARPMHRYRGQRPRIDERDARAIIQLDHHTRIIRQRRRRLVRLHQPVPGHSKVHDDRVARIQREQLVLPASLDAGDRRAANSRYIPRRQAPAMRPVQNPYAADRPAYDRLPQYTRGMLDFGQFRHSIPVTSRLARPPTSGLALTRFPVAVKLPA